MVLALAAAFGCEGDEGPPGPQGPPGDPGINPDATPLEKAILGVGGEEALDGLGGFRIEASGDRRIGLEGFRAEDESGPARPFEAVVAHDVAGDRLHIDYERVTLFGGQNTYAVILDGDVGVVDGVESAFGAPGGDMTSDRWAATRKQERLLNPQLLLREVAADPSLVTDGGLELFDGSLHHVLQVADEVYPISLFVDARTGELAKLETVENDFLLGDSSIEVFYGGWQGWGQSGSVRFPADVVIALAGEIVHAEHRAQVAVNPALDEALFAFPDGAAPTYDEADAARGERNHQFHESFATIGVPLDGLQVDVVADELAPGVYHIIGGSHHSMVVEQADGLVFIEAPLYEARGQAVLDWAAEAFPGKPVTHVVATHHHRDHTGSLRTAVARGAQVLVGEPSRAFFERVFAAPHTVEPDELAREPRRAEVVPVSDSVTLADPVNPVVLHHIQTTHSADFVIAELPAQGMVFQSDLYSPGNPPSPGADRERELYQAIVDRELSVQTMVGGHGTTSTFEEFEAIAD